jgi:hypothetical protein
VTPRGGARCCHCYQYAVIGRKRRRFSRPSAPDLAQALDAWRRCARCDRPGTAGQHAVAIPVRPEERAGDDRGTAGRVRAMIVAFPSEECACGDRVTVPYPLTCRRGRRYLPARANAAMSRAAV